MNDLKSYKALILLIFRGGNPKGSILRSLYAFTMAEILISLTIIGIIAAITLPALQGNINEKVWNTQKRALYSRMSQAISMIPALNGYGNYVQEVKDDQGNIVTAGADDVAESFIVDGLSKILQIDNVCKNENLLDCGLPATITSRNDLYTFGLISGYGDEGRNLLSMYGLNHFFENQSIPDYKSAAFETKNGESIVVFYNPLCEHNNGEIGYYVQKKICANFVYDLNGKKGPNKVGKDVGIISVFFPTDSKVVTAYIFDHKSIWGAQADGSAKCKAIDSESRVSNIDELSAIFINKYLLGNASETNSAFWSSTVSITKPSLGYCVHMSGGYVRQANRVTENQHGFMCVKR